MNAVKTRVGLGLTRFIVERMIEQDNSPEEFRRKLRAELKKWVMFHIDEEMNKYNASAGDSAGHQFFAKALGVKLMDVEEMRMAINEAFDAFMIAIGVDKIEPEE